MPAPRKYSAATRAAIVRECLETANCAAVGRKYGVTAANAIRYVKEAGADYAALRTRSMVARGLAKQSDCCSRVSEMVADYRAGVTMVSMVEKYKASERTIWKYLRSAGVEPLHGERYRHKGREDA